MVARLLTPLGGRTVAFFSNMKPKDERAIIVFRPYEQDDFCANLFAQGRETRVLIGKNIEIHSVVGQFSNVYSLPKKSINGMAVSCNFFGRKVVVRIFEDADNKGRPVYAVLHKDNPWMKVKEKRHVIPEQYFYNMNQVKNFVSQASIITMGSAYQLFTDARGVMLSDILSKLGGKQKFMCRVWLQVRKRMPMNFINPINPSETLTVFPFENETFPRSRVIAATPSIGNQAGSDTLDLRRFLDWRAVTPKKMGRALSHWVR